MSLSYPRHQRWNKRIRRANAKAFATAKSANFSVRSIPDGCEVLTATLDDEQMNQVLMAFIALGVKYQITT